MTVGIHDTLIQTIFVAAQPERSVFGLIEACYLLDDATARGIQFVSMKDRFACPEINFDHTPHVSDEERSLTGDDRTYASPDNSVASERSRDTATAQIVEIDTVIGTNPQTVVDWVVRD